MFHRIPKYRRVVLTPRCWRQVCGRFPADDGGKRAVHRGEHEVSRKATAQGRPGCSVCTCMLVCVSLCAFAHDTAGAASTRSSLRPLFSEGKRRTSLGRNMPRDRAAISSRHCEERMRRSNQHLHLRRDGLLRFARNDVESFEFQSAKRPHSRGTMPELCDNVFAQN